MRQHITASELYALRGLDKKVTQWMLWDRLKEGENEPSGDYVRWQSRLAPSIADGIAQDFGLKIGSQERSESAQIMTPKCWSVAPHELTMGNRAVMIVNQKTSQAMHDWKAPDEPSSREMHRMKAVAAAFGVDVVLLGTLVDGYTGQVYRVKVDEDERKAILEEVSAFIKMVVEDEEPDFDVVADRAAIRSGKVSATKLEASGAKVETLLVERNAIEATLSGLEAQGAGPRKRLDQINTMLIALASGAPVHTDDSIITVTEDARGVKKLKVEKKALKALF